MMTRLIPAFAIALISALLVTWAFGMTSGRTVAVLAYAAAMTLVYEAAAKRLGNRVNVPAAVFAVTLPAVLIWVRLAGHDQQQWVTAAVACAALAAGVALLMSSRASGENVDRLHRSG